LTALPATGALRTCPGCGLALPRAQGPAHPYIGASPECWALLGELLVRGGLDGAVDTYAVQHPGRPERRAIQSVGTHLVWLCFLLERGAAPARHADTLRRVLARPPAFRWLAPPEPNGVVTVGAVLGGAATPRDWAGDVWSAWTPHHEQVRAWADTVWRR
jgi:hypothetical protein